MNTFIYCLEISRGEELNYFVHLKAKRLLQFIFKAMSVRALFLARPIQSWPLMKKAKLPVLEIKPSGRPKMQNIPQILDIFGV